MIMLHTLPEIQGKYRFKADLAKSTWFKVGGPAEILFKPHDIDDLAFFLANTPADLNFTTIGVCSNVLIRDGGIDGVVIKLGKNFNYISFIEEFIDKAAVKVKKLRVGAGVLNHNLAKFCASHSIKDFEFMSSIPGTIGGGIAMNAGAYGREFKDNIDSIIAVDSTGKIKRITSAEMGYVYRGHSLEDNMVFVEAVFNYEFGETAVIEQKMADILKRRLATQPVRENTGGSTFKNPPAMSAWQLIEQAGLRGARINDAQISELHCNFMINNGNATAEDLENLGELARRAVFDNSGIKLNWEIKRIGKNA